MGDEIRVLIADDNATVRRGLRAYLDLQEDLAVVGEASNGNEAVELAAALGPDVVLMDLAMPELDGVAAARLIRTTHPRAKVLVLTSFLDDDRVLPALGAGVSGYVLKDLSPEDLADAVRTVHGGDPFLHPAVARRMMEQVAGRQAPHGTVTILFTDIEDSTRLTVELGDEGAREIFREHDRILRTFINEHEGIEVKHTGDGLMAAFAGARRGIACAIEMQRLLTGDGARGGLPVRVRMGLNTGEAIFEGGDYFGEAVNLASRVAGAAHGGQILVSEATKGLAADAGFRFADRGEHDLKGVDGRRRLFEVLWNGSEP